MFSCIGLNPTQDLKEPEKVRLHNIYFFSKERRLDYNGDSALLPSYLIPEAYSEPCETSTLKHFAKIVNG